MGNDYYLFDRLNEIIRIQNEVIDELYLRLCVHESADEMGEVIVAMDNISKRQKVLGD